MRAPKLSTHSGRLERWLGKEQVENLSKTMSGWYGNPIAVGGVPGAVYVGKDGDFVGRIRSGLEATGLDIVESFFRRLKLGFEVVTQNQLSQVNSGFTSVGELVLAAATAKRRRFPFYKVGATGLATTSANSLWQSGNYPAPGGAASAAPGGRVPDSSTTGAFPYGNPTGGATQHFAGIYCISNIINMNLLLYDRIFDVAKTMNSTTTEAVTGVPTRYTNTTAGTIDSAENNFLFIETQTALAATAHSWATCLYTNQAGSTGISVPSITGNASSGAQRFDMPNAQWFAPLQAGDTGISALTQMQCGSAVATGAINFVMGHPLAFLACPIINTICIYDGISTAFNMERIFDSACLAFIEPFRATTSATTWQGQFITVSN